MIDQNDISEEDIENVFDSYMKTIIKHAASKEIRRQAKWQKRELTLSDVDRPVEITFEIENDLLNALLDKLNESDRNVIIMNICEEMALKEIATILDMNYQTVRTKKQRALIKLKKWGERDGLWKI